MCSSKPISFIVPPGPGGVRDYTEQLVRGLKDRGYDARVVVWNGECAGEVDECFSFSSCIYIQYSGYGYSSRGAPFWLLRCIQRHREKNISLGVYFHELFAFGAPWRSAFWLSPAQRYLSIRLAEISDFWLTNRKASYEWLSNYAPNTRSAVLPVFSNVGESSAFSDNRAHSAVIFGGSRLRQKTWISAGRDIFAWADEIGCQVHDIGPDISDVSLVSELRRNSVRVHGRLTSAGVEELLSSASYGILTYPSEFVSKSGVFAAYCAHGVTPIVISESYKGADALVPGEHYLKRSFLSRGERSELTVSNVRASAFSWYQSHSVSKHIEITALFASNS